MVDSPVSWPQFLDGGFVPETGQRWWSSGVHMDEIVRLISA